MSDVSGKDAAGAPGKGGHGRLFVETLLATLPVPVFYKDAEGRYTGFNDAFLAFTGRTRGELLGKTVFATAPPEIARKYKEKDDELLAAGGVQVYEWKVKRADGEQREVVFHKALLIGPGGGKEGIVGVIEDITDRRRAEIRLKESEEKLRTTLSSMADSVFAFDAGGILQEFYPAPDQAAIFGAAAPGLHYGKVLPPGAAVEMAGAETRMRETMKPQDIDFYAEADNRGFWYNMRVSPRRGLGDEYAGMTAVCRDISDRKRVEEVEREVKDLRGLIPICASCKKVRDDKGYWQQVESYLEKRSNVRFTHGLCKDCEKKIYGGQKWYDNGINRKKDGDSR